MNLNLPQQIDRESLNQLSKEELVDIMIEQAIAIQQLQATITELKQYARVLLKAVPFILKLKPKDNGILLTIS